MYEVKEFIKNIIKTLIEALEVCSQQSSFSVVLWGYRGCS